jgi:hypothetical protein
MVGSQVLCQGRLKSGPFAPVEKWTTAVQEKTISEPWVLAGSRISLGVSSSYEERGPGDSGGRLALAGCPVAGALAAGRLRSETRPSCKHVQPLARTTRVAYGRPPAGSAVRAAIPAGSGPASPGLAAVPPPPSSEIPPPARTSSPATAAARRRRRRRR